MYTGLARAVSSDHLLGVQGDKKKRSPKTGKKTHERNVRRKLRTQRRYLRPHLQCVGDEKQTRTGL